VGEEGERANEQARDPPGGYLRVKAAWRHKAGCIDNGIDGG